MTNSNKRPVWISVSLNYNQSTRATHQLIWETPEATFARIEDGCFDGGFKVEFFIDNDADLEIFARNFIEKMQNTSRDGKLADDPWWGEGEIDHRENPNADVYPVRIRPAPVA